MSYAPIRLWLPPLAFAVVVAVAVGLHPSRPAAPRPGSAVVLGPDLARLARQKAKLQVVDEVIAGRLALPEAAAAFRAIADDTKPLPDLVMAQLSAGGSEEDAYCRMVISWVRANAPPGRVDELTRRLEAEQDARLRGVAILLPQP